MTDNALAIAIAWQAAANARDAERLLALSDPEIELLGPRGLAQGSEVLRQWLDRAGLQLTTRRAWVAGATVVLDQHGVWRDLATGELRGAADVASVLKVAGDRVIYFARYDTPDQALAAAGLEK